MATKRSAKDSDRAELSDEAQRELVHEAYAKLGHLGGEKVKAKYGDAFFSRIGEKGGQARKAQMARGEIAKDPQVRRAMDEGEPLGQR